MDAPPDLLRDDLGPGLQRERVLAYKHATAPGLEEFQFVPNSLEAGQDLSAKKQGPSPMDHDALIAKLSRELDAMAELLDTPYTTESPEVQDVPLLTLNLNIGEVRLIRELLMRNVAHC